MNNKLAFSKFSILLIVVLVIMVYFSSCASNGRVEFIQKENMIDVMIDGQHAVSYLFGSDLTKPILYSVRTPSGIVMNRSFPFKEVEGESRDHPHHTGVFFTYDEVNEDGFWNNTTSPPQIRHIAVNEMNGGRKGTLSTTLYWVGTSGKTLLEEKRTMSFYPGVNEYSIDFSMTLTAKDTTVVFGDTKEGMFGIRVADWLREKDGTGKYLSSRGGKSANDIWGKRAEWVRLEGENNSTKAGVAILNHTSSTNFPTFWHARDYGLFSANPLGQYVFQKSTGVDNPQPFELTLQQGESALFRFRMIIYDGARTKEDMNKEYEEYRQ